MILSGRYNVIVLKAVSSCDQVWSHSFGTRLAIREASNHAQCATCTRAKMLIKKLSNDQVARDHQVAMFQKHLATQYSDRTVYWASRAMSRLPLTPTGNRTISIVADSIDHNKFRWPRSKVFLSKEFGSYIRPTMDLTCLICHGHFLLLGMSQSWVRKDSSFCTDLLLHALHSLMEQGTDLRSCEVLLQTDNCCREWKNNCLIRMGALLTASHKVARFESRHLMTGHSHEDIDQFFSQVGNMLESSTELHSPSAFVRALETWLAKPSVRPHEPIKSVRKIDTVRAWSLGSFQRVLALGMIRLHF